jgi:hypothetical protein
MIISWKKFFENVGKIGISDIHAYIEGMELSSEDKLFFLNNIVPDVIVDFGCADGTILSKIKRIKPSIRLVGYDMDKQMIIKARSRFSDDTVITDSWKEVTKIVSEYKNPTLVLSSVIHEVYSYSTTKVVKKFWDNQVFGGSFKYICIRDMIPSVEMDRQVHKGINSEDFMDDVRKIRMKANTYYLESFEDIWGSISNSYRTLIHFLLKYKYTDNWNREVNENYVPITLETLYKKIPNNYSILTKENYILPNLEEQVKKDFDIDIIHTTHTKMIIKNNTFILNQHHYPKQKNTN